MTNQRAAKLLSRGYAGLTGALLLRYPVMMFLYRQPYATPGWVAAAELLTVLAGIVLGKLWKDRAFLAMLAFWALLLGRVLVRSPEQAWGSRETFLYGLWALCGCYGLGGALTGRQTRDFLRIFTAVWVLAMTVHASLGLYAAWHQRVIWNLAAGGRWGLGVIYGSASDIGRDMRLYLIFYPTISGSLLCVSALLACHGLLCSETGAARAFYGVCAAILMIAMALTDTRTSNICLALGLGGFVFLRFGKDPSEGLRRPAPGRRVWLALLLALVAAFLCVLLPGLLNNLFNQTRSGAALFPSALAESAAANTANVANRGYFGRNALSGRPAIWQAVIAFLGEHPKYLLMGTSIISPMNWINPVPGLSYDVEHAHNILLQVLLESGIPGLLLVLLFVGIICVRAFRMLRRPDLPNWVRGIPVIVFSVWIGEMVECVYRFERYILPLCALLFLLMGIVGAAGERSSANQGEKRKTGV